MKAVVLNAYGDVNSLEFKNFPEPQIGANEIKVRMAGAGLNPIDWKLRSGAYKTMMPLELPTILGRDVSGTVVELGSGVTGFKVGDRVMGLVMGGYAELVVAATSAWAAVPSKMDLVDAAALPLVLLTGSQLIDEALQPKKGDVVLITGALGGVGRTAVFAAKNRGATVWAAVRGSQMLEAGKLGAAGVVSLDDDADIARLPLLDGIADTVGGPTIAKLLTKVKPKGTIASVVGEPAGAKALGLVVRAIMTHADAAQLGTLAQAVADGRFVIPIATKFPLAEARAAQTLAANHAGGKVLLTGSA